MAAVWQGIVAEGRNVGKSQISHSEDLDVTLNDVLRDKLPKLTIGKFSVERWNQTNPRR